MSTLRPGKFFYPLFVILLVSQVWGGIVIAQHLSAKQWRFVEKKAVPVLVEDGTNAQQWPGLKKELADKRIVLIGEFTHGAREVFELKNELMKYLHSALGFDLILFESGIGELITINLQKDSLSARKMTGGLIGPWRTQSFESKMDWVKTEQLEIAGFDVQRSGQSFQEALKILAPQMGWKTEDLIQKERQFGIVAGRLRKEKYEAVSTLTNQLMGEYQQLIDELDQKMLRDKVPFGALVHRTFINRKKFLSYFLQFSKDKDYRKRWVARDSMMADNIRWLLSEVYPDKKVMISAHNFHVAKFNEKEEVMGEMLLRQFGDQMYSIGLFAGGGELANNSRATEQLAHPDPEQLDIKHIINHLKAPFHFLPIPARPKNFEWMYQPIIVNDSFIDLNGSNKLTLARHFDGLLLINKVSVPVFEY